MYNFKLLLLGLLVTMFVQCNVAKDSKGKSVTTKKLKTVTTASVKGRKAGTTASVKGKVPKAPVKEAKKVQVQEDVPDTEDPLLDQSPNEIRLLNEYDDEALEEKFNICLKNHGTSLEKYDKQLEKCAHDLQEPTKIKQWLKDNCKHIENTGFPTCYDRSFNKIFNKCYNDFPYNSEMIVENMRRKYAEICDLPTIK